LEILDGAAFLSYTTWEEGKLRRRLSGEGESELFVI